MAVAADPNGRPPGKFPSNGATLQATDQTWRYYPGHMRKVMSPTSACAQLTKWMNDRSALSNLSPSMRCRRGYRLFARAQLYTPLWNVIDRSLWELFFL
jgi:hypothetical protein